MGSEMCIRDRYHGRVVGLQPFGAFIELLPGKDGLLHISRVAKGRVEKIEDVLSVGDEVDVVVLEVDDKGKISLDRLDKPEVAPSAAHDRPERSSRGKDARRERGYVSKPQHRHFSDAAAAEARESELRPGHRQLRRHHTARED